MELTSYKAVHETPSLDNQRSLRRCLGKFPTGVAVITAKSGNGVVGMTVNSFSSVSLDPPIISWSIGRNSKNIEVFQTCEHFAVNILSEEQSAISNQFAGSTGNRFSDVECFEGKGEAPLISGCVAHFECTRHGDHWVGDHLVLFGSVSHFAALGGVPLLFVQGEYCSGVPLQIKRETGNSRGTATANADDKDGLVSLIYKAQHHISSAFAVHQRSLETDLVSARVLAGLYETPGLSLEAVVTYTSFDRRYVADAVKYLQEKKLLEIASDGSINLTSSGERRREEIRERWVEFRQGILSSLTEAEIASSVTALNKILSV